MQHCQKEQKDVPFIAEIRTTAVEDVKTSATHRIGMCRTRGSEQDAWMTRRDTCSSGRRK